MALDHIYQLVDIAAWNNNIADFLFWLHLLLHQELIRQLFGHHIAIKGKSRVLLYLLAKHLCELEQLLVLGCLIKALFRVRHFKSTLPTICVARCP